MIDFSKLNNIKNNKLIKFDEAYSFTFLDLDNYLFKYPHPVSDYYFKLSDVSINLLISLKWSIWGYRFFTEISNNIPKKEYDLFDENIQKKLKIWDLEISNQLFIDNELIESQDEFIKIMENDYNQSIFDENTKIHIKLKLNLKEYLILTNTLFPTFIN